MRDTLGDVLLVIALEDRGDFYDGMEGILLTFLICILQIFDLSGTHVDVYPYSVAKITISNVDKLKIMTTVSSSTTNPDVGRQNS